MTLEMKHRFLFALTLAAGFVFAFYFLLSVSGEQAHASAPSGIQAKIASTSQITVGGTVASLPIVATSSCSSRIVSTGPQAVMLTMDDALGKVPTGIFGYYQAASTTSAYDSGLYGCGALRAYGAGGVSSTITVSDVQ